MLPIIKKNIMCALWMNYDHLWGECTIVAQTHIVVQRPPIYCLQHQLNIRGDNEC